MTATVGENIKRFRELRGYSQDFMAHKMNITQGSYAKIEKENTKLTLERLQQISEILELDMSSFINTSKQNVFNQQNNETALGYIENYNQKDDKLLLEELINTLKNQNEDLKKDKLFLQQELSKILNS